MKGILQHLKDSKGSANFYQTMLKDIKRQKLKLGAIFIIAFLIISAITLYCGLRLAKVIATPLNVLLDATKRISNGDYTIRVEEQDSRDEINILAKAFNRMTSTIEEQRDQLLQTTRFVKERAIFIEMVLSEISSGVITLDSKKNIMYINDYAIGLLNLDKKKVVGLHYKNIITGLDDIINLAEQNSNLAKDNIDITLLDKTIHIFASAGVVIENKEIQSYIITFDDITDHMVAQRLSAWADVAQRVAHEIKNPLTPIALSAERLGSKFAKQISEDSAMYDKYIYTIINHTEDIRRIVEDFVKLCHLLTSF